MTRVDYPVVERVPHFEVVAPFRSRWESTNQILYRNRELAEAYRDFLHQHGSVQGDGLAKLIEHEAGCYVRCVVCGETSDDTVTGYPVAFPDWPGVTQYVAATPGWTTTGEQHVFCPNHRPSKED